MGGGEQRLQLTWHKKDCRLLAHDDTRYEWVEASDVRVDETRLFHEVAAVGEISDVRAADNLLIRGDSLHALTSLNRLPEFADQYQGQVRLVYVDLPFNTGKTFKDYDDNLEHSVWLTGFRDRLEQIVPLLAPDGSIWVHLDDAEQHRARLVLDEVLGPKNFVATVIWQKRTTRESRSAFSSNHDYIHVYAPAGAQRWKETRNKLPKAGALKNPDKDPRGPWSDAPFTAPGYRANQQYIIENPAGIKLSPPRNRSWYATEPVYQQYLADGRIYFTRNGAGKPRLKTFPGDADENSASGVVAFSLWQDLITEIEDVAESDVFEAETSGVNDEAKDHIMALFPDRDPFDTPKPEQLLERIIHIATSPGEIVLDCFVGSGTTGAVALKMGRRFVVSEWSADTVANFTLPRLEKVVAGEDPGGISEDVGWEGGGGFRVLEIAPSMFETAASLVLLADWATNGELAEPVAAQLGYTFEPVPPWAGHKGRSKLAVIDGVATKGVADFLLDQLDADVTLVLVATAVEPGVEDHVREQRPGSRVKKVPRDLLPNALRPPSRLRQLLAETAS